MDESYFAGAPKYNQGRCQGTTLEDDKKWIIQMAQHEILDCVLKQVPSNRTRRMLILSTNKHCLDGTLFNSDG